MQSSRVLLAIWAALAAHLALAAQLRSPAPAPAAAPSGSPAGSPGGPAAAQEKLDPLEVVEEAHHANAKAHVEHVLDKSKQKLKEASIVHAQAGVHVATANGDHEAKKDYQEKVEDHKEDLVKLKKEAEESSATHNAAQAAYKNAEAAAASISPGDGPAR